MTRSVTVKDLQVGMKVSEPVLGKKGDIKVNKGEILSKTHVDKMQRWAGLDAANPRGIQVESTLKTGTDIPDIVDHPERSPIIETGAKKKLTSSMQVPVGFDKEGNVIEDAKTTKRVATGRRKKKGRA